MQYSYLIKMSFVSEFEKLSESGKQKVLKYLQKEIEKETNKLSANNKDICIALRANGTQCTRQKKNGSDFCGTHIKAFKETINSEATTHNVTRKEIWTHDFNGIIHYVDAEFNVYKHDDVMNNTPNPKIIHKYKINEDGIYVLIN